MSYTPENPSSDLGEDAQAWLAREFAAIQQELQRRVVAGSASLFLSAPAVSSLNITPTPTKVTGFDSKTIRETEAFASISNSTLEFIDTGLWNVGVELTFEVVPDTGNQSREVYLQFYNEVDASPSAIIATATIPRYDASVTLSGSFDVDIEADNINEQYALYIYSPSGHTIAVTGVESMDYYAHRVSKED